MTQRDVSVIVSVTKSRKGWQVTRQEEGTLKPIPICWFASQTEAYAFAWKLENGL